MPVLRGTFALVVIAAVTARAGALDPGQVLVVANTKAADSVVLAQYYAKARAIPKENVLLINTARGSRISRKSYDEQIRFPIRRALLLRKLARRIRCVCLMWGVPVHVAAPAARPTTVSTGAAAAARIAAVYLAAALRAHCRLAIDYKLLDTIGKKFPEPRTTGLKPLGKLFAPPLPHPPKKLPNIRLLKGDIKKLLASKQAPSAHVEDPAKRKIWLRQVMAMHLELYGLAGLVSYLSQSPVAGGPGLEQLKGQLKEARDELSRLSRAKPTAENVKARLAAMEAVNGVSQVCSYAYSRAKTRARTRPRSISSGADATVDSELALLWWGEYKLSGPMKNPLHWRMAKTIEGKRVPVTLMTARIDGPTHADAKRMIDSSLAAQKTALAGKCYIDAGGKYPKYEVHFSKLHAFMRRNTNLDSVLDRKKTLFQPGACPQAALYVGWYSLRRYVPAFRWVPGAVGWHVASFEAADLRNPKTTQWCAKMIQGGVAATIGAVAEPGLAAFPLPEEFFPLLLTGKYTVAECYWRTVPLASWRLTLIADPLYNPFAAGPQVDPKHLPEGLSP